MDATPLPLAPPPPPTFGDFFRALAAAVACAIMLPGRLIPTRGAAFFDALGSCCVERDAPHLLPDGPFSVVSSYVRDPASLARSDTPL
jgi:hypothetical protein